MSPYHPKYPKIRNFNCYNCQQKHGFHWSSFFHLKKLNIKSRLFVFHTSQDSFPPLPFWQQALCSEARIGLAISCSATNVRIDASGGGWNRWPFAALALLNCTFRLSTYWKHVKHLGNTKPNRLEMGKSMNTWLRRYLKNFHSITCLDKLWYLHIFTNLDFFEIRGCPFLSYILEWGRVRPYHFYI